MIEQFSSHVLKSPSIAESSFFSHFDEFEGLFSFEGEVSGKSNDASNGSNKARPFFERIFGRGRQHDTFRHAQHEGARTDGTYGMALWCDDHNSPLTPNEYLGLRVKPMMKFYQKRLPICRRRYIQADVTVVCSCETSIRSIARLTFSCEFRADASCLRPSCCVPLSRVPCWHSPVSAVSLPFQQRWVQQ